MLLLENTNPNKRILRPSLLSYIEDKNYYNKSFILVTYEFKALVIHNLRYQRLFIVSENNII